MSVNTVLLDLDGVIRHFDPTHVAGVEKRYGLGSGSILDAAFEPALLAEVITGQITHAAWVIRVGEKIGAPEAANEWASARGGIDEEMLSLVDALRDQGVVVAILTNGTDTVREELRAFGVSARFDGVFNSAEIGHAKPDRRAFEYVCEHLGCEPARVFFTDDSPGKLDGALELGMHARPFVGVATFRQHLGELLPDVTLSSSGG